MTREGDRLKSGVIPADAARMSLHLSAILSPGDVWLPIGVIAALLVLICLKFLAEQIDHETKWHNVKVDAHHLRQKQVQRLRLLGVKSRR